MALEKQRTRLRFYLGVLVATLLLGTAGFMLLEGRDFTNSLYFTVVTIATVGYGDIAPTTEAGKFLAILLILLGVGTFLSVIATATELLLGRRDEEVRQQKQHMIIGLFFSEVGNRLLQLCVAADPDFQAQQRGVVIEDAWGKDEFHALAREFRDRTFRIDPAGVDFDGLHRFLQERGDLLARLLENPLLHEHDIFSELLVAILHLREELRLRPGFADLPGKDLQHLGGDLSRTYGLTARIWVGYLSHLKTHFPFLYSLAQRTNPFDRQATVVIR